MTLLGSSSKPAESKIKQLECLAAGGAIDHPPIQQPDKKGQTTLNPARDTGAGRQRGEDY